MARVAQPAAGPSQQIITSTSALDAEALAENEHIEQCTRDGLIDSCLPKPEGPAEEKPEETIKDTPMEDLAASRTEQVKRSFDASQAEDKGGAGRDDD